jgi:hypothetical protein
MILSPGMKETFSQLEFFKNICSSQHMLQFVGTKSVILYALRQGTIDRLFQSNIKLMSLIYPNIMLQFSYFPQNIKYKNNLLL